MEPKTEPKPVQSGAHNHLGSSMFAADAAHVPGAALARETIFRHLTPALSPIEAERESGAAGFGEAVASHGKNLTTDKHGCTRIQTAKYA